LFTKEQKDLLVKLKRADAVLFGEVISRKYGLNSPVYLDLRDGIYRNNDLLWKVGGEFLKKLRSLTNGRDEQVVVGVPDTATPLAVSTVLNSSQSGETLPVTYMLLRKEARHYGGQPASCIVGRGGHESCEYNLIDDVVASGLSKWRAIEALQHEQISVKRILTFFDRQQGGAELLEGEGYPVHSIFKIMDVLSFYLEEGLILESEFEQSCNFLRSHHYPRALWRP